MRQVAKRVPKESLVQRRQEILRHRAPDSTVSARAFSKRTPSLSPSTKGWPAPIATGCNIREPGISHKRPFGARLPTMVNEPFGKGR